MTAAPVATAVRTKGLKPNRSTRVEDAIDPALVQALEDVHAIISPLWPLADYVAVNPFMGLIDRSFLEAHLVLGRVRDCDLLMPREYFQTLYKQGRFSAEDLSAALTQCAAEHPEWYRDWNPASMTESLQQGPAPRGDGRARVCTVAEAVDRRQGSTWSSHIVNDITRHCSSHYDEGQASWKSPWKDATLYTAWREAVQLSRRMDLLGLKGFRAFVSTLPTSPEQALSMLLEMLEIPPTHTRLFLLSEAFSVAGWTSYVRYRVREAELAGRKDDDLIGLLAIRLAYDAALARTPGVGWPIPLWPADAEPEGTLHIPPIPDREILTRYAFQVAAERKYRRDLLGKLSARSVTPRPSTRKTLQMVFCIDVRSEVMRRHLESVDDTIETFGFAGFFGMPLEYVPIGFAHGTPQCPVLLQPSFQVQEGVRGVSGHGTGEIVQKRLGIRQGRKLWKTFQSSATTCFSFVESLGWTYFAKLLSDTAQWTRPVGSAKGDGLASRPLANLGPDIHCEGNRGLDGGRRIDLAEGMLRNLGLIQGFARTVILCGHASDVTNNPYRAALDCGACGGHSGEPNARVAAAILNDGDVRIGLASRGIAIPCDTLFLAAVHNTTTDEIQLCDAHLVPDSHAADIAKIQNWLTEASRLTRLERSPRLGSRDADEVKRRSRDWAEVRPEWGLAGNAAFLVAPRSRTEGINLSGRTFLHSYDHRLDPDLKVLELILTAPMVVTNWINMQYYASSVDPIAYGSGNKVIHNLVGQFGVLQGNGGDLMNGLPWQSVHDGKQLQHEPLRLMVLVDAPRSSVQQVLEKHAIVRNLATNGWVCLVAWEDNQFYRWTANETWELEDH